MHEKLFKGENEQIREVGGNTNIFSGCVACIRKTVLHVCGLEHAFGRTPNSAQTVVHVCKTCFSSEFIHIHIIYI